MGSGWFRFAADRVECESYGPSIGRVSQTMPIPLTVTNSSTRPQPRQLTAPPPRKFPVAAVAIVAIVLAGVLGGLFAAGILRI